MKKLISVVLALAMILSLSAGVFAYEAPAGVNSLAIVGSKIPGVAEWNPADAAGDFELVADNVYKKVVEVPAAVTMTVKFAGNDKWDDSCNLGGSVKGEALVIGEKFNLTNGSGAQDMSLVVDEACTLEFTVDMTAGVNAATVLVEKVVEVTGNVFAEVSKEFEGAYWENSDGVIFVPSADGTLTVDVTAFSSDEAPEGYVTDLYNNDTMDWGGEYYATEAGKVEYPIVAGTTYILYVYPAVVNGGYMNWATGGSVTYTVSADVACELSEIKEPEPGEDENNPIYFDTEDYTAVVPAYTTVWYAFDDSIDMWDNGIYEQKYTVTGAPGFGVMIAYESYADENGTVTGTAYGSYMGYYLFGLTNDTAAEQTYTINFSNVEGSGDDDDDVIGGDEPGGDSNLGDGNTSVTDAPSTDADPWTYEFVIDTTGVLTVVIGDCNPGWRYKIVYPDGVESLYKNNFNTGVVGEFPLSQLGAYKVMVWAYSSAEYSNVDGTISCDISFTPDEVEIPKDEYVISDTILDVGENDLTMIENAENTLFEFAPSEIGTYTFTAPEGILIGDWGAFFNPMDKTADKTNTLEWTCTAVGQSILVGVAGEEDIVLNIEKTADGEEQEEIEYEQYVDVHVPTEDNLIDLTDDQIVVSVDITKPQTVVKDENGFYHLGSVNGPMLYVNLISDSYDITQAYYSGMAAMTLRGAYTDEDGNVKYYDFLSAMNPYADVVYWSDYDNGLYPMTEDLMIYIKAFGAYQGWYKENLTPFEAIKSEHNADSAWLVSCVTVQTLSEYRVVGDAEWLGAWDAANEDGRMIDMGDGIYQITFSDVAAGSYELKVTKGSWDENWGEGGANGGNIKFDVIEGEDVVVTFNAKTGEITIVNGANAGTGDYSIAGLVVAMMAATAGAVVLTKKKEF